MIIMKFKGLFLSIYIAIFLANPNAFSQNKGDSIHYFFETGSIFSLKNTNPFWLLSNNYGTVSANSPGVWARTAFSVRTEINKTVSLIYGADIIDRFSNKNEFILQQAYAGIKVSFITLKGGSCEEKFGNQDNSLSSGGILWSGNARPMPKISILIPEYVTIPFTKGIAEFKGGISHGWFGNNQFVNNSWLHHKYAYLRFGGKKAFHFEYGLHHFAQWGGTSLDPEFGDLPDDFSTFLRIFFAQGDDDNAPINESKNAIGNHLGSHNVSLNYKGIKTSFDLYWQSVFEDGSGMELRNFPDGLWGFKVSSESWKYISKIVLEIVSTTDQSGKSHGYYVDTIFIMQGGNDDYFTHFIYEEGWTKNGMTIGTPFITSPNLVPFSTDEYLPNNKIRALHIGIEGKIDHIDYIAFYTVSGNYGTNNHPFPDKKDQHSVLLKGTINNLFPCKLSLSAAVAFDIGELYKNNLGLMISLKKEGIISSLLSNH